ncbi:YdbH domain-containing protein [Zooshikella ganghwensis]|uniref:Uncharacterized protein n=1 Tax=Zooshikella ganghwensis TaxID=202772 RepID=A0A4P9VL59_9GAMM|nr:YdbH domain-containing protein [Zooshikella ganghwensis]RDH43516.1 hypothetical protein B9G39_08715 [Zooshikella ganghwensis]
MLADIKKVTVWLGVCLAFTVVLLISIPWIISVAVNHIDLDENITVSLDQAAWHGFGKLKFEKVIVYFQQEPTIEINYLQLDVADFFSGIVSLKVSPNQVDYDRFTLLINGLKKRQTSGAGKSLFPLLPLKSNITIEPFFLLYSGNKFEVVLNAEVLLDRVNYNARITSTLGAQLYTQGYLTEQEVSGRLGFWALPFNTILPSLIHRVRFQPGLTHFLAHYKLLLAKSDKSTPTSTSTHDSFLGFNLLSNNNLALTGGISDALVKGNIWGIVKLKNQSLKNMEVYLWPASALSLFNSSSHDDSFVHKMTIQLPNKIIYQNNNLQSLLWQVDVNHDYYQGHVTVDSAQFNLNDMSGNAVFNVNLQQGDKSYNYKSFSLEGFQFKAEGWLDISDVDAELKLKSLVTLHNAAYNTFVAHRIELATEQPIQAKFQRNRLLWDIQGSLVNELTGLKIKKTKLPNLKATHDVQLKNHLLDYQMQGNWTSALRWEAQANLNLLDKQLSVVTDWETINAKKLQRSFARYPIWPKELTLTSGIVKPSLKLKADWRSETQWQMNAQLIAKQLAGQYQDYQWQGAAMDLGWQVQERGNQMSFLPLTQNKFKVDLLNVGIPLQTLRGRVAVKNMPSPWLSLERVNVKVLQGNAFVQQIPIFSPYAIDSYATFEGVSLSELVTLQEQPGLSAQGQLQGRLPLRFSPQGITIHAGQIQASKAGGFIKVEENPTVDALKQSRPEFSSAINALENLHFSLLESSLDLKENGDAKFKVTIKGKNPTLSQTRQVNFNYQHEENMLMLLRSLRFSQRLTDKLKH